MFELDWAKLVIIGVVALIVIGPKELPSVLRTMGQWMAKIRRMAAEFQGQLQEAMREAEMADLKQQVDAIHQAASGLVNDIGSGFDPIETTRREIKDAIEGTPPADGSGAASAAAHAEAANGGADVGTPQPDGKGSVGDQTPGETQLTPPAAEGDAAGPSQSETSQAARSEAAGGRPA